MERVELLNDASPMSTMEKRRDRGDIARHENNFVGSNGNDNDSDGNIHKKEVGFTILGRPKEHHPHDQSLFPSLVHGGHEGDEESGGGFNGARGSSSEDV